MRWMQQRNQHRTEQTDGRTNTETEETKMENRSRENMTGSAKHSTKLQNKTLNDERNAKPWRCSCLIVHPGYFYEIPSIGAIRINTQVSLIYCFYFEGSTLCLHGRIHLGNVLLIQCRSTWTSSEDQWFWQTSKPNKSSGPMSTWMPWYECLYVWILITGWITQKCVSCHV